MIGSSQSLTSLESESLNSSKRIQMDHITETSQGSKNDELNEMGAPTVIEEKQVRITKKQNQVPMTQRRGFLSFLSLIPEYEDARNYSSGVKLLIVFIVAIAGTSGPMGVSIILPAMDDTAKSLNTTVSSVNISIGIYSLSLGLFPMWWSHFADKQAVEVSISFHLSHFLHFPSVVLCPNP